MDDPTDPDVNVTEQHAIDDNSPATTGGLIRTLALAKGALLGAVGVTLIAFFVVAVRDSMRDRLPLLTREDFDDATRHWDANGPQDYDLDISVEGRRAGVIHVEVRHGEVTQMIRDGVTPSQQRTWYFWSVPGQLETIGQELDKEGNPTAFQAPAGAQVIMQATFDPRLGYPLRYRRSILGTELTMGWTVTHFEPR